MQMDSLESTSSSSAGRHEEIKELERLLEEKKRSLGAESGLDDKEVLRQVFQEKYGDHVGGGVQPQPQAESNAQVKPVSPMSLNSNKDEDELADLIQLAINQGVAKAIKRARESSPWLMDALHDRLVDEYYQKIIEAQHLVE